MLLMESFQTRCWYIEQHGTKDKQIFFIKAQHPLKYETGEEAMLSNDGI